MANPEADAAADDRTGLELRLLAFALGLKYASPEGAAMIERATAFLAEQRRALQATEEWWLREGMKTEFGQRGAPYCIFAVRAVLAKGRS